MATGAGLATRGYVGGGAAAEANAPTITAISPTPETDPGDAGGFSASYAVAAVTAIVLEAADAESGIALLSVVARFIGSDVVELVYRNGNFRGNYIAGSSQSDISGGSRLNIKRDEGWPGSNTSGDVILDVDAVDGSGNYLTATLLYTLPSSVEPELEPEPAAATDTVDHVAVALSRVRSQFRD